MKLKRDNNGNIGMSEENVINFANHYLEIMTKINTGENLSEDEKTNLMLLLHKTANEMLIEPTKFLNKKPKGRPNKGTKQLVRKTIRMFLATGTLSFKEAKRKAEKWLSRQGHSISLESIEKQAQGMDISKYIKKKGK